jgi:hypothetical protein
VARLLQTSRFAHADVYHLQERVNTPWAGRLDLARFNFNSENDILSLFRKSLALKTTRGPNIMCASLVVGKEFRYIMISAFAFSRIGEILGFGMDNPFTIARECLRHPAVYPVWERFFRPDTLTTAAPAPRSLTLVISSGISHAALAVHSLAKDFSSPRLTPFNGTERGPHVLRYRVLGKSSSE